MRQPIAVAVAAVAVMAVMVACHSGAGDVAGPAEAVADHPVAIRLVVSGIWTGPGDAIGVSVLATDAAGRAVASDAAEITLASDSSAYLEASYRLTVTDSASRRLVPALGGSIRALRGGRVVMRARLGDLTDSATRDVPPLLPISAAAVVDSFALVEFRPPCGNGCTTYAYTPTVALRVPDGASPVKVVFASFILPPLGTVTCRGGLVIAPGMSRQLVRVLFDGYFYEPVFAPSFPAPLPDAQVFANLLIEDAAGARGWITVAGGIKRDGNILTLPLSSTTDPEWSC